MLINDRKQQQRQQREQLILDTAQHILSREGYASLTMERVASEVAYSKGTIYNHFSCKEDIIGAISCRCMRSLQDMFRRGAAYPGTNRERIAAVIIAHSLYAQLHPVELQNMQIIKSEAIREKISAHKQAEILGLEQQVTGIAMDIVHDAIAAGDIPAEYQDEADAIVFGLWTMGYGSSLLHLSGIPFASLGMRQPLDIAWINSNKLLDSYLWRPLGSTMDIHALKDELTNELFQQEKLQLQQ